MKKTAAIMMATILSLMLVACGRDEEQAGSGDDGTQGTAAQQAQGSREDQASGENVAQGTIPGEGEQPTGDLTGNDVTEDNGKEDSMAEAEWSKEMQEVKKALTEALGENYWPDTAMGPDMLSDTVGLSPQMYDDILAEMPSISTKADTLIIVSAKEDQVETVESALNAYRDALIEELSANTVNAGKVQASRIEKIGNYVCFIQLGADVEGFLGQGEDAVIKHCLEQNELAIEVIRNTVVK